MEKEKAIEFVNGGAKDSAEALRESMKRLAPAISDASDAIVQAVKAGGKTLVCGNGGSAADSQHMAAELIGRFLKEREPYAAVALSTDTSVLTSLSNDYGFETVFERQVKGLGAKDDVLFAISTSGNSTNVLRAMDAAREIGMTVIAMTGKGGGKMADGADILLDAESKFTPRIQEVHGFIVHIICDLVERTLTGE